MYAVFTIIVSRSEEDESRVIELCLQNHIQFDFARNAPSPANWMLNFSSKVATNLN